MIFHAYANPVWNHIHILPNKAALQSQPYIQDNNDYYTLSEILEKFPSAIETLRFHLHYIYDIYYVSV